MARASHGGKVARNQQIINEYLDVHGVEEDFDMRLIAPWAITTGRWVPEPYDPVKACARELSRAAREEYYVDPQNRKVRKKHCYVIIEPDGQRRWHWVDIVQARPEKIQLSLQQRRQGSLQDVAQIRTDKDSYNDNNPYGAVIEMSFNFDEDLAEMDHPTEYPEHPESDD